MKYCLLSPVLFSREEAFHKLYLLQEKFRKLAICSGSSRPKWVSPKLIEFSQKGFSYAAKDQKKHSYGYCNDNKRLTLEIKTIKLTMKISCNGETKEILPNTSLIDFIRDLNLNPDTVVAEFDGKIVNRDDYETLLLQEGSVLELIRFVGGG